MRIETLLQDPEAKAFLDGMRETVARIRGDSSYPAEPDFEGFARLLTAPLLAKVATLEAQKEGYAAAVGRMEGYLSTVEAERDRLKGYASHKFDCAFEMRPTDACTCGLSTLLGETGL